MSLQYRCPKCGLQRLTFSADVKWDADAQRWEVIALGLADCNFCGLTDCRPVRIETTDGVTTTEWTR